MLPLEEFWKTVHSSSYGFKECLEEHAWNCKASSPSFGQATSLARRQVMILLN